MASVPGEGRRMVRRFLRLVPLLVAAAVSAGCVRTYYRPPESARDPAERPPGRRHVDLSAHRLPAGRPGRRVEAELARLLGTRLGRPVALHRGAVGPADRRAPRRANRHHHVGDVGDGRAGHRIAFTEPYLEAGLVAAVRTEDARRYGSRTPCSRHRSRWASSSGRPATSSCSRTSRTRGGCSSRWRATARWRCDAARSTCSCTTRPSIAWLVSANEADLAGIWQS